MSAARDELTNEIAGSLARISAVFAATCQFDTAAETEQGSVLLRRMHRAQASAAGHENSTKSGVGAAAVLMEARCAAMLEAAHAAAVDASNGDGNASVLRGLETELAAEKIWLTLESVAARDGCVDAFFAQQRHAEACLAAHQQQQS